MTGKPREKSSVYIANGKIKDIGPTAELTGKYKNIKHIDLKNTYLLPGFINAHTHLELAWITKFLGGFNTFAGWISQIINAKKNNITTSTIVDSVRKGIDELIASGITTVGEVSSYDGTDKRILKKSGLRTIVFNEVFDRHLDILDEWKLKDNHIFEDRLFPHAPYSCSPETLQGVNKYCKRTGVKAGIHLAESREETLFVNNKENIFEKEIYSLLEKQRFSKKHAISPVRYLSNYNFFDGIRCTLIHMVHVSEDDIRDIVKNDIGIVICPRSNNFLNVGLPPLRLYKDLKRIGIGTDGLSSNFNMDMFEELRFFYLTFKETLGTDAPYFTLYIATLGGARSLFIDDITGSIETGKYADLIAVRPSSRYADPYLDIISAGKDDLLLSMVNGKIIFSKNIDIE